jgi:hypothetical protein
MRWIKHIWANAITLGGTRVKELLNNAHTCCFNMEVYCEAL